MPKIVKPENRLNKILGTKVTDAENDRVIELAKVRGISKSAFVRIIISEYLEENDK